MRNSTNGSFTLMIDGKNERKNVEGIIKGIIKVLV